MNIYAVDTGKVATFSAVKSSSADEHLPFFNQMKVTEDISTLGEIEITLTPPTYSEALELLKSPWLVIGNTVSVRWGYSSDPTHFSGWHHGMLLQPDVAFGDQFSVTLKCQSFGWLTARATTGQVWSNPVKKGSPLMSPFGVIEEIAKRYNYEVNWNDGYGYSDQAHDYLFIPNFPIIQSSNDFIFMKSLCVRGGCRFFITKGNRINVIDGARARDPEHTFVFRGQIDPANNVWPITSFDSETTAMFLPQRSIAGRFFNPNDKRSALFKQWKSDETTVKDPAISGTQVGNPGADGPKQKAKDGEKIPADRAREAETGTGSYVPMVMRQKELASKLQSQMDNIFKGKTAASHGVSAKIQGVDVPLLLPESIVAVKGVGDYHSVNYRVHKIEHTIGDSFAVMSVDLHPKGFPGNMAQWLAMKAPVVKQDKPKPQGPVAAPGQPPLTFGSGTPGLPTGPGQGGAL